MLKSTVLWPDISSVRNVLVLRERAALYYKRETRKTNTLVFNPHCTVIRSSERLPGARLDAATYVARSVVYKR
jgi:hypothetical protein